MTTKELFDNLRSNILELGNGSVFYIGYDEGTGLMYAGTACNTGISRKYVQEYDEDFSLDENLAAFIEVIYEGEGTI